MSDSNGEDCSQELDGFECVIGIDPGLDGGIAIMGTSGVARGCVVKVSPMPVYAVGKRREIHLPNLEAALSGGITGHTICFIETQGPRPTDGCRTAYKVGLGYGYLLCTLYNLNIPIHPISPAKWKKAMGVTNDKGTSIKKCMELFPKVSLMKTERCTKPHDGLAEALLIAEFGRRTLKGVS